MTILIVDDEFYLVQGVKKALNWEQYDIDTIYTAYSADQARKVYEENHVDILLCDIEMPRENGLDLIKWVNENGYDSVNILLTGHASFEYARTAVHLQIFEYVLKPVDENSLGEVIHKATDMVRSLHNQQKTEHDNAMKILWHRLYSGTVSPAPDSINDYLTDNNLSPSWLDCSFSYAYLQIKSDSAFTDSSLITVFFDEAKELKAFTAQTDVGSIMISIVLSDSLKASADTDNLLSLQYNRLLELLKQKYPTSRFVIYTLSDAPLTAAPYAHELLKQYSENILSSDSKVIPIMTLGLDQLSKKTKEHSLRIPLEKWEEYLSQGRTKDILLGIRSLLMQTDATYSSKYLQSIYYGLLSITFSVLTQKKCSPIMISEEMSRSADPRAITSSSEGLYNWAQDLMRTVDVLISNTDSEQSVTEQVKLYIKSHISDSVMSRTTIADSVHVSPDYLSFLFHRETGMVLSSYINNERISAAKKLLLNTSLSSQEIAEKAGFSNVSYFHKQFKKVTGMTPNSYKDTYAKS